MNFSWMSLSLFFLLKVSYVSASLRQIAYYSAYKNQPTQSSEIIINDILNTSRRNNAMNHITGFLMFKKNVLLQYIEGEEASIEKLMINIMKDPRHCSITFIHNKMISERDFPNWQMYYTVPSFDLPNIPFADLNLHLD